MAILLTFDFPGITGEDMEAISAHMRIFDEPPLGLIAHIATDAPDAVRVIEIWDSEADFQKFAEEQLMPAIQWVSEERGFPVPDPLPEPTVVEAYDVVRGA